MYAPDEKDGRQRAQNITADGYVTNTKSLFYEVYFSSELPEDKKQSSEILSLKKFNEKFGSCFK